MINTETVKVGDPLYDLVKRKWITVCGCKMLVRSRLAYAKEHPEEFAYDRPAEVDSK